jgi:hypothetical protein
MTESFASSDQSGNIGFQGAYSNPDTNENNHNRKQKRRPMQTSSQDVRYNPRQYYHQQQQQQWYEPQMYYGDNYQRPPFSRGGHHAHNQHQQQQQHQQRRPQHRHPVSHSQANQQATVRPNSNSSIRSTSEVENLRSILTEQLFENIYECMICIIKIEYVIYFYINKLDRISCLFSLVEIKKYGHVMFVIKCFI